VGYCLFLILSLLLLEDIQVELNEPTDTLHLLTLVDKDVSHPNLHFGNSERQDQMKFAQLYNHDFAFVDCTWLSLNGLLRIPSLLRDISIVLSSSVRPGWPETS